MELPPYHPTETESIEEIPERFLAEGYLQINRQGEWRFQNTAITHPKIAPFLWKQLMRTKEGKYWVVNGPQRVFVEIEDTPYVVTGLDITADGDVVGRLNDGSREHLDLETFRVAPDNAIYTRVHHGEHGADDGEAHDARLSRAAVLQLAPFVVETAEGGHGIELGGRVVPLLER